MSDKFSSCERKKRYKTKGLAEEKIEFYRIYENKTDLRVYKCDYCNGYHITHATLTAAE